jgi:hypothetical protein
VQHAVILNILQTWRVWRSNRADCLPAWLICGASCCCANPTLLGCPGAWFGRRSGIKEEESALGRHGGQPRSRPSQASGRTNTLSPDAGFQNPNPIHAASHKANSSIHGISHRSNKTKPPSTIIFIAACTVSTWTSGYKCSNSPVSA